MNHETPELSKGLYDRIRLVRRDIGNLLFHFTRKPPGNFITVEFDRGSTMSMTSSAYSALRKILYDGRLMGTSKWTYGYNCVCFTEAPIQEFNSVFSLVEIASSKNERPRYEPYGIAVSKKAFFKRGGRPVIYDHPSAFEELPESQQYRFVPYDPENKIDFTWEREWRIRTDFFQLDPKETLVVVPTSDEAFDIVYQFANIEADYDRDGSIMGAYHEPKWLAVSLDLFGVGF
ncbi:MAG: hypothetical protein JRF31_11890 [Deltaproteobacteria bacterium]|nr:hypothetical protein [Deltaproteobacteria bacterium]